MGKSTDLTEKIESLLERSSVYFHQNLHKANDSSHFNPAKNKADIKQFGKDSIVHHDITKDGIKKYTHAVVASNFNPGAFEHHTFEYDNDGKQLSHAVKSFSSQADALGNLQKSSKNLKKLFMQAEKEQKAKTDKVVNVLSGKSIGKDVKAIVTGR